jgi:hypothetical protein
MELILQLFGLLCGGLCWALIMLAWLTYVWKGKPPKPVRYIGTGFLLAPMILVVILVANWFGIEERQEQLLHAAFDGDTVKVERALKAGADVNQEEENMHFTLLMCAVCNGHTDTVQAILRHHPDLNHRGVEGTALQMAMKSKDGEILHLLKAAGAKE